MMFNKGWARDTGLCASFSFFFSLHRTHKQKVMNQRGEDGLDDWFSVVHALHLLLFLLTDYIDLAKSIILSLSMQRVSHVLCRADSAVTHGLMGQDSPPH